MIFGIHCDTSLAIADAIIARRPFTALRTSDGVLLRQPVTLHHLLVSYYPKVAA